MIAVLLLFFHCSLVLSNPLFGTEETCPTACHPLVEGKINVHLIPHSHDDVGWLKTYDQYYVGTGRFTPYENAGVQYIISSTVEALKASPDRRFIQVETAFFYKWWNDQTEETRNLVQDLINKGQLEMVGGGWSMNDEAAAHYQSIIDQFTWGFRILNETVGQCGRPRVGWQIDPFGHSREHAYISKELGFEGLVVGRIDFRDKETRIKAKNLDFLWNTNDNFEDAQLFTTMFPDFYASEKGFCFDVLCSDEITDGNVKDKIAAFAKRLDTYKNYYKTSNIMLPMGNDFHFQKAEKNFGNIDKLIEGFKNHETYNVIYSTPSCYINAVKDAIKKDNIELTVKADDFFPYASDVHDYWTGYFTSRPTQKRFERLGNNILQSAKQLTTLSRINGNELDDSILNLRIAMGVMQHHDAITGTEKQAVANDYSRLLTKGIEDTEPAFNTIITGLLKKPDEVEIDLKLSHCLRTNMSICDNSKKDKFVVAVHNPVAHTLIQYIRLPVDGENYKVTGSEDEGEVHFDVFDTIHTFDFVDDGTPASKELVFLAKLPPLAVKLYYVEKIDGSDGYHKFEELAEDRTFGDATSGFKIDENGKLSEATIQGKVQPIQQDFYYYNSSGGAYVFKPDGKSNLVTKKLTAVKFAKGTLIDEVHQIFSDKITQIIRVYKHKEFAHIEFDWLVGDLEEGKEIITRFQVSEFKNDDIFYTDSNGRQQIERKRNSRSDYEYDASEDPVTSNYYPVTSKIVIRDETKKLEVAVLNDRAQGGSSLEEGQLELMIHRCEKRDDGKGVSEILDEKQYGKGVYARGQHYLTFAEDTAGSSNSVYERKLAQTILLAPVVLVGDATGDDLTLEKVQKSLNFKFEPFAAQKYLPDNVHILTLEPWKDSYLLRLEHYFEKNEDSKLSQEVTFDLKGLFSQFNIVELTPINLGAYPTETEATPLMKRVGKNFMIMAEDLSVTLKPMEIQTFLFKTDKNNDGGHNTGIGAPKVNSAEGLSSFFVLLIVSSLFMLF